MQIHELNNFTGTLGAGSYVAIDDGNDTGKVSTQQILANTEARIDNIIAGEAPSAAEVTDARYGADGVTYTSLGTAIRTQFTDVKSEINAKSKAVYDSLHLDASILINSGYIASNGTIGANANYGYSNLMPIPNDLKSITINCYANMTGAAIAYYSDNAFSATAFIEGAPTPSGATIYTNPITLAVPEGAKYFALSGKTVIPLEPQYAFDAQLNFDFIGVVDEIKALEENAIVLGSDINIANADLTTASTYIAADGTKGANGAFACSAMYELPEFAKEVVLSASGTIPTGCAVAFYFWDAFSANAFISGVPVSANIPTADAITIKIPSGARYVAFSGRTANTFSATIKTKTASDYFPSQPHKGEYLSILGDSISSYQGYIPEGNDYYYPQTYLSDVECAWWKRLLNATGMQLLVNNSWSGSLMSGTAASVGLSRCENLDDGTHSPDHIIVFMGVNDFKYPRALGECGLNNSTYSVNNYSDAYYTALNKIRTKYPNAKLYLGTIMEFNYPNDGVSGFPIINRNGVNLIDFNNAVRKLADLYGAEVIEFTKCGITYFNKAITLGDQAGLHPNANGHNLMFEEALKHFI